MKLLFISFGGSGAYREGFRDGLRDVLEVGRYGQSPVGIKKRVGTPATDSAARYGDVERVRTDVRKIERIVLNH